MEISEFKKDFMEDVKSEAALTGEGTCATFVEKMARYLIDAEVISDFTPSFYTNLSGKKKYRVDGYVFSEFDYTMNLIIADFDGTEGQRTMSRAQANIDFGRVQLFVEEAINSNLYKEIEMSTPCADLVDLLRLYKDKIRKYQLLLFTEADMSGSITKLDFININGISAECQIWNIDRLFRVCASELGRQRIEINFCDYIEEGIPCLEASNKRTSEYNSYLCVIPGTVLADIYDKYGSQLLEGNVRSFLSTKVAVNKKIRETILRCPAMFFAYNNGVAATAMNVQIKTTDKGKYVVAANDFQIINGGQTTASLSNARYKDKANLDAIYVQMKLTEIEEGDADKSAELIRNISRSSNSQNKVSDADFFATHPFHVRMEQFSRRIYAPATDGIQYETKWFYERARGQYLQAQMRMTLSKKKQFVLQNPKNKVITKTDLAKIRNSWNGYPQVVSKGAQTNFMKFAEFIEEEWIKDDTIFNEKYYTESVALMILFRHTESMITRQAWYAKGYRANIVTYSIALLHMLIKRQFKDMDLDLQLIWQKQSVPDIINKVLENIAEKVYYKITDDPSKSTVNVTQWCKRDACWKSVQEINVVLPEKTMDVLIGKEEQKSATRYAKKDQRMISGIEAQTKVLEYNANTWNKLYGFVAEKKLATPEEVVALKFACQIPNKIPSAYQSQKLLALMDKALAEGFKV